MSNVFDAMLSDSDSDGEEVEATMEDHDEVYMFDQLFVLLQQYCQ